MKNLLLLLLAGISASSASAQQYITDDDMESTVMVQDDELKILYFTATWCGPCKMMAPIVKELDEDESIALTVYKMDIDHNMTNKVLGISSIPTYLFIKNGRQVGREMSVKEKSKMYELVEKYDNKEVKGKKLAYKFKPSKVKMVEGNHKALSKKNIKKIWYDAQQLSSFASNAMNALEDKQDLKSALSLVERSLELEENSTTYIVQSKIYLKMNQLKEAKKSAATAKKMLGKDGESTGMADNLLEKIDAAR